MDAGPAYQKNLGEEVTKLQRLYGGGDLNKFPEFKFTGQFGLIFSSVSAVCWIVFNIVVIV